MQPDDIRIVRHVVARFRNRIEYRVASRFFEERYARLLIAMSMQEAKTILGFPPTASPSSEEVTKAYRTKAFENHPDRGGDPKKMVDINVAKDVLEGKGRATPEPAPKREKPKAREPDAVDKGQDFNKAWGDSGAPANVEWKFISIPEFVWPKSSFSSTHPGYRVWVLYGQTEQKHIFVALRERGEGFYWKREETDTESKYIKVEEDWQSSMVDVPLAQNIAKISPKYLKTVGTAWADGISPKPPKKFLAWPGGKPTQAIVEKMPRSGGAGLKEILVGTGLLNDEDPSVAGRKSVIEVFTKYSKERLTRMKKLRDEGKLKHINNAHQYDFFVRVNGKTEQLSDDTITKMERVFIPWVLKWEISEGAPKNLTRMRGGGRLTFDAATAIRELANCLTGEPSWVHIAMEKAAEEWEEPKTAALMDLRDRYTLREAAKIAEMSPYDFFQALHGVNP